MHNAALNSLDVCLHNTHTSICKEKYGIKYCIVPRLPLRSRVRPLMSRCKRCDSMKVQLTFASTGVAIDTHTHTHTHLLIPVYSRWKPAAETLMSDWKVRNKLLEVLLSSCGMVVPVTAQSCLKTACYRAVIF